MLEEFNFLALPGAKSFPITKPEQLASVKLPEDSHKLSLAKACQATPICYTYASVADIVGAVTQTEMNLQKLRQTRNAQKAVIAHYMQKLETAGENTENAIEFETILQAIEGKYKTLEAINEKILTQTDGEDIESEMLETEDYMLNLQIKIRNFQALMKQSTTPPPPTPEIHRIDDLNRNESSRSTSTGTEIQFHNLPKLNFPTFSGNILDWQTFWDSFESSVHLNSSLSQVQKFSYLRSLLHEGAAQVIEGFPLTHGNYLKAVDLLQERFGQTHMIVDAYMQALMDLPRPTNNLSSMRTFTDKLESYIRGLESLGQCQESYGSLLVPVIKEKLPAEVRRNITRDHGDSHWQLPTLRAALKKEITIIEAGQPIDTKELYDSTAMFHTGTKSKPGGIQRNRKQHDRKNSRTSCPFCGEHHSATFCTKVSSFAKRIDIVKRKHLCFNCLGNHQVSSCRSNFRCRHCRRKHHSSICNKSPSENCNLDPTIAPFEPSTSGQSITSSTEQSAAFHLTTHNKTNVLLKTAITKVSSRRCIADANILFDEGAQRSFITEELADKLELQRTGSEVIHIAAFDSSTQKVKHIETATVYLLTECNDKIPVNVLVVPTIAVPLQNLQRSVSSLPYLRDLKLAHPVTDDDTFDISLVIGADKYWDIVENEVVRGCGPTAVKSKIGYLLSGPLPDTSSKSSTQYIMNVITAPPDLYNLERFWKLESLGVSVQEETDATSDRLKTYQKNNFDFKDGRYIAKLPWEEDHKLLPDNYNITLRRTQNNIRRLRETPKLLQKYGEIIADQEQRGFIERINENQSSSQVHYIPHHAVKKESSTTPIRIVFDCSCRESRDSPSLNDCLESTPPELNDLTGI
ncbi:uncharacterized protein LOC123531067 [Mercenaria mercenaria]|uniref:uncharacterized protein LOC123531067 n=1 Tax=Mercenaria mercenaria TaxID=6596 RepID=UPI00234E5E26|nr:uncharacterized protein LOC123531067 [Mercenaria mercenaria]